MNKSVPILIVGGGSAGLMAALAAGRIGVPALILEKGSEPGRKLAITGGGRGNFTHVKLPDQSAFCLEENADKLLRPLSNALPPAEIRRVFAELGVSSYVDEEGRVYPKTNQAADLVEALRRGVLTSDGQIAHNQNVVKIESDGAGWVVSTDTAEYYADSVIVASGGASYPHTGSSGDSQRFFRSLDLRCRDFTPALAPLLLQKPFPPELEGISLPDAALTYRIKGRRKTLDIVRRGAMLWQKRGLSGPLILNSSADFYDKDHFINGSLRLNFLPDYSLETFTDVLRSYGAENPRHSVVRFLKTKLPNRLAAYLWQDCVEASSCPETLTFANLSKQMVVTVSDILLDYPLEPAQAPPLRVAMASRGGLDPSELNLRTMAVKSRPGLYAVGECVDFDFISGGWHLTFAFQSAWLAGQAAARETKI